jgi:hypothetical protein
VIAYYWWGGGDTIKASEPAVLTAAYAGLAVLLLVFGIMPRLWIG